jgi:hypothetical protein
MRKTLSRLGAIACGAALTAAVLPAGTASALTSGACPEASSTRLFTGGILGSGDNKLWLYSPTSTTTYVCFDFYPTAAAGGGVIVVDTGAGITPPSVVVGSDPSLCTTDVVDITDPVRLHVALGTSGTTVCFTLNSSTTTLTFGLPGVTALPSVQIWRDGTFGWLDLAACAQYLPEFELGNTTPYETCVNTNARIV